MDFQTYKKFNIEIDDIIGIEFKDSAVRDTKKITLQFKLLTKEENPTKYWIHGINHVNLNDEKYRVIHIENLKILRKSTKQSKSKLNLNL